MSAENCSGEACQEAIAYERAFWGFVSMVGPEEAIRMISEKSSPSAFLNQLPDDQYDIDPFEEPTS